MFILLLVLTTLAYFSSTFSFSFISDDFFYLTFSRLADVIYPIQGFYHYSPVFWMLMWLLKSLFGYNSLPFHISAVVLHVVNVFIFYKVTSFFLKDKLSKYFTSVIFAFYFAHYEIVYWVTGIDMSLMILFYLLGFLAFSFFVKNLKSRYLFLYYFLFTIAILTHEYAVSLPFVALFYWIFYSKVKIKLGAITYILAMPVLVVFYLALIKLKEASSLFVQNPTAIRFTSSVVKSLLYLLFPFPDLIDFVSNRVLMALFLIVISPLMIKSLKRKETLFLLIWLLITILVFSVTSLPQARYLSLSAIPAVLLIFRLFPVKSLVSFPSIYFSLILISSILFLNKQKNYWEEASRITRNVLSDIKSNYPNLPYGKILYFVNLPDSVNGPPWNAYVFRNGLEHALAAQYKGVIPTIRYNRTIQIDGKVREDPQIEVEELKKLQVSGDIVFIFEKKIESVRILDDGI